MAIPRWYEIANGELGTQEIPGAKHNPSVLAYHAVTGLNARDDETPWCASFVSWCLEQAGLPHTGSAAARSYLDWGRTLDRPTLGCVVVFSRGSSPTAGHVGFYAGKDRHGNILVLGGNQGNRVSVAPYSAKNLLGYRWPASEPLPPDVQPYRESRVVQGTAATAATGGALTVANAAELASQLSEADRYMSAGTVLGLVAGAIILAASVWALVSRIRAARQ